MKSLLVVVLLLTGFLVTAHAQQADDKYIGIYGLIQQAQNLDKTGDAGEALAAYKDAEKSLQQFQRTYPTWNPTIVNFRLNQISDRITELNKELQPETTSATGNQKSAGTNSTESANAPVTIAPQTEAELKNLRSQLQTERQANQTLQAKLKEALSVQPAAVDPRELAKAQEKIRWLMKENDLLKASHVGAESAGATARYVTNTVTVVVTNSAMEVNNLAAAFAKNAGPMIVTNYVQVLVPDTNALAAARLEQAAAVKNFNDEHLRAQQLAAELEKLRQQSNLTETNGSDNNVATELVALRKENTDLKNQVATLQSQAEVALLEKKALENRLHQLLNSTNSTASTIAYETRIQDLTQERDGLQKKLDQASQAKDSGGHSELSAQVALLNAEVKTLRSRLAVAEAKPIPFTPEELALFKGSAPKPTDLAASKQTGQDMSADTKQLVASAQAHFSHQEFDQAEADYQKILDRDQNNGMALANIAMIELQEGKLDDAEKHIKAALAQSPDDPYNLSTLGYLKFRQGKYKEALDALSHAAQMDPNNPEIQNYLGLALSHEGQRQAAETALRRAIQINPKYAPAQNNLAVLYLSQNPPRPELARWHYQKALAAGQPRNPDLEKMLAEKGAPVSQ